MAFCRRCIGVSSYFDGIILFQMIFEMHSEIEMKQLGQKIGHLLKGGEVIELIGDVGAGKTTLTKGIAAGMGVDDDVQSPSFTISRTYDARGGLQLSHYDFYRLTDPGIMTADIHESLHDPQMVTIIEWAEIVGGVLPADRISISITSPSETDRQVTLSASGSSSRSLLKELA